MSTTDHPDRKSREKQISSGKCQNIIEETSHLTLLANLFPHKCLDVYKINTSDRCNINKKSNISKCVLTTWVAKILCTEGNLLRTSFSSFAKSQIQLYLLKSRDKISSWLKVLLLRHARRRSEEWTSMSLAWTSTSCWKTWKQRELMVLPCETF